jgi:hypothetical protein
MRLTNFEMDNITLALDGAPSPFATVEVRLSFYDDATDTANTVMTRVHITAADRDTIAEIQARTLAAAIETLRQATSNLADRPFEELRTFQRAVFPSMNFG